MTDLLFLMKQKSNNFNLFLVILNCLTKMGYYKQVKNTINTIELAKVIINIAVRHHGLLDVIISNESSLFTWKFLSS